MRPAPPPPSARARRRTRALGSAVVALTVVTATLAMSAPAQAAGPSATAPTAFDPSTLAPPSPHLTDLPKVAEELAQVPVTSPDFDKEATKYAGVYDANAVARDARAKLDRTRTTARVDAVRLAAVRAAAEARLAGLGAHLHTVDTSIQQIAIQAFVAGGETERMAKSLTSKTPSINETDKRSVLGQASMDVLLAERAAYRERIAKARKVALGADHDLAALHTNAGRAVAHRPAALHDEVATAKVVATERVAYEKTRVLARVKGVEFPLVALDAYFRAAATESIAHPTCGVQWWGVAGIPRVEGRHGSYGGSKLDDRGDTSRPIIGIQLNGQRDTAVIGDTDHGAIDGDPNFDRAVGPMQFIPSTWRRWQADGNGDGVKSPFNMYDATLAAANYLCHARRGLDADPGLRAAYFSYNHSLAYVDGVLGYALLYKRLIDLPPPPG